MSREARPVRRQLTQEMILDPQKRVRELSEIGSSVKVDKAFPVKRYFRSGSEMERQARVYYAEGQPDKAFVLYNKFVTLFLEKLPKQYPDYNKPEYKAERAKVKKLVKEAFPRAEQLKKHLLGQFQAEKKALETKLAEETEKQCEEEERQREMEQHEREGKERWTKEEAERREREEAERLAAFLAAGNVPSDSPENISRPDGSQAPPPPVSTRETVPQTEENTGDQSLGAAWTETAVAEEDQVAETMGALSLDDSPTTTHSSSGERSVTATNAQLAQVLPPAYQGPPPPGQNFSPQLTPTTPTGPHNLAPPVLSSARTYQSIFSGPTAPPTYLDHPPPMNPYYPSAGGQGAQIPPPTDPAGQYQTQYYPQGQVYQPAPPPGGPYVAQYSNASSGSWGSVDLPAPSYHMTPHTTPPTQTIREEEEDELSSQVPNFDRSKKPAYSALSTSIGGGYRMVYVPETTSRKFEEVASDNTRRNVETCAILAGKLSRNQLHVTHVILPKQRGGPDSCETLSEEELFDVQDQHDLITLGWIHTHPSQTAFMSSVDLHTHCSYQIMLDEAIAIVCAPRYSQVGVYMLTEPYGLDYITHCEEEGFHTHPKEPPLYEECSHVIFSQSAVEIVDLR